METANAWLAIAGDIGNTVPKEGTKVIEQEFERTRA